MMRVFGAILMCASVVCSAANAQERLDGRGKVLGWEAIGRLDAGGGFCTGTLIDRDVVLTAAHCVVDKPARALREAGSMTFRAGYYGDGSIAERGVLKAYVPEEYMSALVSGDRTMQIAQDVALVKLDQPVSTTDAEPYGLTQFTTAPERISLVSYGRGRAEALTREASCALIKRYQAGVMGFDCEATFGSSGSPLFAFEGGRLRIFSVAAAIRTGEGARGETFGMNVHDVVGDLKRQMRNDASAPRVSTGIKRLKIGERSTGTGARFVKVDGS